MKIQISTNKELPVKAHNDDACADLIATSVTFDGKYVEYGTDIKMLPPEGYFGIIFPRSSISNYDLVMANSSGIIDNYTGEWKIRFKRLKQPLIDSLYRQFSRKQEQYIDLNQFYSKHTFKSFRFKLKKELELLKRDLNEIGEQLKDLESFEKIYQKGDKIAQFTFLPKQQWDYDMLESLPETSRSDGGFGSTDVPKKVKSHNNTKKSK